MPLSEFRVEFFAHLNGSIPVQEYLNTIEVNYRAKILAHIELLRSRGGKLYGPYTKHISGPVWELRIDLGRLATRVLYFLASDRTIVLLHAFMKKTQKTPRKEIECAIQYYKEYIQNNR